MSAERRRLRSFAEVYQARDEWKARAKAAKAKLRAVKAIEPLHIADLRYDAGFVSGFNYALELVAEAIASVEPSPPEDGQT